MKRNKLRGPYGTFSIRKQSGHFVVGQNLPFFRFRPIQIFNNLSLAIWEMRFCANNGTMYR